MAERTRNDMEADRRQQVVTDTLEQDGATGGRRGDSDSDSDGRRLWSGSSRCSSAPFEAQLKAAINLRRAARRERLLLAQREPEQGDSTQPIARSNQREQSDEVRRTKTTTTTTTTTTIDDRPEGGKFEAATERRKVSLAANQSELNYEDQRKRRQRHDAPTRSSTTAARGQRRGSILERTSIKLNRLLESSIYMLPPPDLSRAAAAAARHRTRSTTRTKQTRRRSASERNMSLDSKLKRDHLGGAPLKQIRESVEVEFEPADDRDVDGGYAWIILAVMFVINASTFGTARAYSMIYDKLAREGQLNHDEAARPFNVMGAIENMAGPLTGCLLARSTSSWRLTVFTGSCLVTLAHLLAALTPNDSIEGHLLSMGLMCGLGLSFVTISFFQINNAYFVQYRSRAFGIGISGAAFGTLYIAKVCQWALDEYEGTSACYLVLCLLLAPNVLLSLLLKPKQNSNEFQRADSEEEFEEEAEQVDEAKELRSVSLKVQRRESRRASSIAIEQLTFVSGTRQVLSVPIFHLIWPTQLLFCWFNFVFGMIMVDLAKDRGLSKDQASHIVPVWAFGQLTGRLILSSLVDLKLLSYRSFTVICFAAIGLATHILNETKPELGGEPGDWFWSLLMRRVAPTQQVIIMMALVFVLSAFIALLYILLNGLVVSHMDPLLQPLSIGISSFLGSFFLLPRASAIGFFRDTTGNYDSMLSMFSVMALAAALTWLIVPTACKYLERLLAKIENQMRQLLGTEAKMSQKPPQLLAVITLGSFKLGIDAKAEKST